MWSYNVHAIVAGGAVPTSPVLSMNGAKVGICRVGCWQPGTFPRFGMESWGRRVANLQNALSPKAIVAPFRPLLRRAASGTATDFVVRATTDTLSSPYIDYANDVAYVGNDAGILYRIKNVFCTTPACGTAQPAIDLTWGTAGAVAVCAGETNGSSSQLL